LEEKRRGRPRQIEKLVRERSMSCEFMRDYLTRKREREATENEEKEVKRPPGETKQIVHTNTIQVRRRRRNRK